MVGVALVVGFGLSWYALSDGRLFGAIRIGPWTAWHNVGASTPDPYTRAYVARAGALQLGASEGMQFTATTDSDGQRLERNCNYRIDGTTPVAAFWTMVPVDGSGRIVTRPNGPAAFNSTHLARENDGSLQLHIGKDLRPQNWLELAGDGSYSLVLTLYDTASFAGIAAAPANLPAIIREGCR